MINLVKGEFYKLFRGKAFWGVLGFMIFYAIIEPILSKKYLLQEGVNETYNLLNSLLAILQEEGTFTVIGILVAIFVVGEFTTGCMKQIATRGFSRTQIFLSKYVTLTLTCIVIVSITLLIRFFAGVAVFGEIGQVMEWNFVRVIAIIVSEFIAVAGFVAIYSFIAFGLCNMAGSVTVNSLFVSLGRLLFVIIGLLLGKAEAFQKYWLTGITSLMADYENFAAKNELIYGKIFILIALVFVVSSVSMFKKKDI